MDSSQGDYQMQLVELERQELESEEDPSPQLYAQLLSLYLLFGDLINAKLLWKRIPTQLKEDVPDLPAIWQVAVALMKRESGSVYGLVNKREWPAYIKKIMSMVSSRTRERVLNFVSSAYSHITLTDFQQLTGCKSEEEAISLANSLSWPYDEQNGIVQPVKSATSSTASTPTDESFDGSPDSDYSQEQLQKLAQYVSFLENI